MALARQSPDLQDRLRQGQVLRNLDEYVPTGQVASAGVAEVTIVRHPFVVVISPECDLVSDYETRNANPSEGSSQAQPNSSLLEHIQCCKLFNETEIRRPHELNSASWNFVKTNRHERYHTILPTVLGRPDDESPLYLDFKRIVSFSAEYVYASLEKGDIERDSIIQPPWIHQLVQRCYAFQARVCVPDPMDPRPSAQV